MDLTGPETDVDRLLAAWADGAPTPPGLRNRVLTAAGTERAAGRPKGLSPLSPVDAYRQTVADLDALLDGLPGPAWLEPVPEYGWTVQGVVGHLIAIDRYLASRLGVDDFVFLAELELNHVAMTHEVVGAQDERDPAATFAEWREASARLLGALAEAVDLEAGVVVHGLPVSWRTAVVARCFEVWTHTDDIRRALGRPLVAPDADRLALMTALAVENLPLGLALLGRPADGRVARVVLTGPGGGAWSQPLGLGEPAPARSCAADVRVVADAVSFCRLAARRLTVDEVAPVIDGDQELGATLLEAVAAFAL